MLSRKSDMLRQMTPPETSEALIYTCRIQKVYPETLSADIYIPQINKAYRHVYIGEGITSAAYRSGGLPDINSEGLVALYSKSGTPVVISFIPPASFNAGKEKFEKIQSGEYQIMSCDGAFAKFNSMGTAHIGSSKMSSSVFKSDGGIHDYYTNHHEVSNLLKKELITKNKDGIISIYEKKEIYENSNIKTYSPDEIKVDINALEAVILNDARSFIDAMFGQRGIFNDLSAIITTVQAAKDCSFELEQYKKKAEAIKLSRSGISVSTELFGENIADIKVTDENGNLISGIKFSKDGAELVGAWKSVSEEAAAEE